MPDNALSLGELLLGHRVAAGLSQEDLAELADVSVRAICDLERGATRRPQRATVAALSRALGLCADDASALERTARRSTPPRRADRTDARLPAPATSFVGREAEVADLMRLLGRPGVRLVTLTGPGGVGKTRLALEVAWRLARRFERVDLAELASVTAAGDVAGAVAVALGVPAGRPATIAAAIDAVGGRHRLLLLDDVDHVDPAAPELGALLTGCRGLTILATGRSPLHLLGEHVRTVAPLPVPPPVPLPLPAGGPAQQVDLAALHANPGIALLVDRAAAVRAGFDLDGRNAAPLTGLVRRLDGMPLAIELAAAQLRTSDPQALLAHLTADLAPVDAGAGPDRDRIVRATVEWTARRLTAGDRDVLAALGAFAGSADPRLLAAVLAEAFDVPGRDLGRRLVRELPAHLAALAAAGLLTAADDARGRVRVHLAEPVRTAAAGLLAERGPTARAVRVAHARALLGLLRESAAPGPAAGASPGNPALDIERDNLRTALDRALVDTPQSLAADHVSALLRHLVSRSRLAEARRRMTAIASARGVEEAVRATAWHGAGVAANEQRDHAEALACAERAIALFERRGDAAGAAAARTLAGAAHRDLGRPARAREAWEAALGSARRARDETRVVILWSHLGRLAQDVGELDVAADHHRRCRAAKQRRGDERGVAVSEVNLAAVELDRGDWAAALELLRPAVATWRRLDEPWCTAIGLAAESEARLGLGDADGALRCARQAHDVARAVGHRAATALAGSRLGDLALLAGDHQEAAQFYTRAMEGCQDATERLRATERLALALALDGGADGRRRANRLLTEAARARRDGGLAVPAPQRRWIERAEQALADGRAGPAGSAGPAGLGGPAGHVRLMAVDRPDRVSAAAAPGSPRDGGGSGPVRWAAR